MWPSFPLTESWCRTLGGSRRIWASFSLTSQPVSFTAICWEVQSVNSLSWSCLWWPGRIVLVYLDLSDFSHLFDWNTKQLFVLLAANYKTKKNVSPTDLILHHPMCTHRWRASIMGQEHVHHIAWQLGDILFYYLHTHTHRLLTRWYYGTRSFTVVTPPWWSYTQPKASMASSMMAEDSCKQQLHCIGLIPMSLCGQGMGQDATSKYCLVC